MAVVAPAFLRVSNSRMEDPLVSVHPASGVSGIWRAPCRLSPALLSTVLSFLDVPIHRKMHLASVSSEWRQALHLPTAWKKADLSHRPCSSLIPFWGKGLGCRLRGARSLTLAEDDSHSAVAFLLSQMGCDARESAAESRDSRVHTAPTGREGGRLRLPFLRCLRIHQYLSGGYSKIDVPQFILQALDSAARSANDGQCCESDSLEEIVVDCDIPTAAFAQLLNGRVGRLRRIVFTQLPVKACHDGMQPPTQTEQQEAPSATPLELLLLLLEEIPPNQLEVVGLNFSLRPDTNQAAEETPELRARVQALRSSRGKPGAPLTAQHFGNALLQLLTERQSASVRYLWAPDLDYEIPALKEALNKCTLLTADVPGAFLVNSM